MVHGFGEIQYKAAREDPGSPHQRIKYAAMLLWEDRKEGVNSVSHSGEASGRKARIELGLEKGQK